MTKEQIAIIKKARSECHAGMGATAAATLYSLLLDVEKQEQGEPVAWMWLFNGEVWDLSSVKDRYTAMSPSHVQVPLYTTPQQRKPLTDEQIKKDFEKWAKENYSQGFEPYGDSYHNGHTRNRWQGWLAAHRAIKATNGIKP